MAEELELTLTGMAYGGEAFGRDPQGRMVFVAFALPGERVRAEAVEIHRRWARARLLEVLEASPERVEPRCRHFTLCGGCHYQHLPYQAQLRVKAEVLREQLERLGGFSDPPVEPTVPSPAPWNYRNHVRFHLTEAGALGFVRADGRGVFAVEECHLPEPDLAALWPQLDLEPVPGLEEVGLRAGAGGETMVILHGAGDPEVAVHLDLPASVVWLGPRGAAVLAGEGHLVMEVLGRPFRVSAASFFQVNSALVGDLVGLAMEALGLKSGETFFDLYAGVGLFSAFAAEAGARVVAVEESPWACADFEVNLAEFEEVSLYEAPVETALPAIEARPDAVLVDPPRGGLGRGVVERLLDLAPPRLVYVSCDPATLARDGKWLAEGGYRLERVVPIDLFPQTYHIESLSLWRR